MEEIGRRLGLGYKAAESLLTRARQAFREGSLLCQSVQFDASDPLVTSRPGSRYD